MLLLHDAVSSIAIIHKTVKVSNSRFLQFGLPPIDLALLTLFSIRIQTSSTRHMDSMSSILQAEDRSHLC